MSGEVPSAESAELAEIVRSAVGTESVRVMSDFDSSEVVPKDAAAWARMIQREPRLFKGDWVPHGEPYHDEL